MAKQLSALRVCPNAMAPFADGYTETARFEVGQRVELSPGCDLWARGAKYGAITRIHTARLDDGGEATCVNVRMDHPGVKHVQRFYDLTLIRHVQ